MAESKKYWYIQLNVNFFEDERIDWLCEQKNGYAYVVLYLKLCLKTANNNGILTRQIGDMIIPYNVDKIAEVTHMNVDIVRVAFELYKRIGLVYEADENCNFMRLPEVAGMVGYTTQYAIDKARQREKNKSKLLQQSLDNVQDNVQDNVLQELRVKSLELRDKSLEKNKDSGGKVADRKQHGEYGWVKLTPTEYEKLLTDYGREKLNHAITYVDELAQSTGNKNKWKDWNLVVRRAIREGWGNKNRVEETPKKKRRFETVLIDGQYVDVEVDDE